ncbi:PPP1R7 [Acanthosepion pharaonis]|uniref:PPP1R7 n=1 Tax=Acanthosepion pharaonis TaxID=158019 RepID=A0A812C3C5_ACAPH|nr:PPP1R7 [Sepia pharaonis]
MLLEKKETLRFQSSGKQILQELKLYGNRISSVENTGSLKELRYLQLQYNSITTLGEGLKLKNLICLRLDHNNLTEIKCSQLCGCSNLRILNISSNRLTNLQALKVLPQLEELLAASNKLKEPPDLTPCHNLKEINLSDNQLTRINGLHFMKALEVGNTSFYRLHLGRTDNGAIATDKCRWG